MARKYHQRKVAGVRASDQAKFERMLQPVETAQAQPTQPLLECSICNRGYGGIGNSAYPVNNGRCCDACNTFVIWMRMQHLRSNA